MVKSYAKHVQTKVTPQTSPIPGSNQIENSAGGYAYAIDDWARLDRFLILGCEGGTYYTGEKKLTLENAQAVQNCLVADGERTVARIKEISLAGRAPKQNPAIFALALAASSPNDKARQAAYKALPEICRTGTHLFQFVGEVDQLRGWGRGLRNAVARWYTEKDADGLAYQLVKYQQREGWSHRDLLRLSHPKPKDDGKAGLYKWAVKGVKDDKVIDEHGLSALGGIVEAFERAKVGDKKTVVDLIRSHNLPRECVPTNFLNEVEVWDALLEKMPMTAMIRNLAKMTAVGLLTPLSDATKRVTDEFGNVERIRKARIHPINVLVALKTYSQGRGEKGSLTWTPNQKIVDGLNGLFYATFPFVEPTGKKHFVCMDVSASMSHGVSGCSSLSCCEGASALAMVIEKTEEQTFVGRFNIGIQEVPMSSCNRLDEVLKYTKSINGGGTDCALPMKYAMKENLPVDVFVVLTDNETWAGTPHPSQALKQYREKSGIDAKLAVFSMTASEFTIADKSDPGMLDFCGFDTAAPQALAEFAKM